MAHKGTRFIRVSVHSQPKPYRPQESRKVYTKGRKEKLLMNRTLCRNAVLQKWRIDTGFPRHRNSERSPPPGLPHKDGWEAFARLKWEDAHWDKERDWTNSARREEHLQQLVLKQLDTTCERMRLDLIPCTKFNSKWNTGIDLRARCMKPRRK